MRYKDGAWRLCAQVDGRRHYKTVQGPDNRTGRRQAEAEMARLVTELGQGRHLGDHRTTFADLAQAWLEHRSPSLEARTVESYRADLDRALPDLGALPLRKLRPHDLDRLYLALSATLAPKTVRNVHGTIHAALVTAVRWGWVDTNPADRAEPPVAKRAPIVVPTPAQVGAVIAAARADFAAMVRVAATTGHRRGTLLGLRWTAVDLDVGAATFGAAVTATKGELHDKGTKADRTDRAVLGPTTLEALRTHRARCVEAALSCGVQLPSDGYVWSQSPDGSRPWHPGGVGVRWRATCRRAGVAGVRFHDLRHFAISYMLAEGVPPFVVASRVGIGMATMTKVYAHFIPGSDDAAATMMDALLG